MPLVDVVHGRIGQRSCDYSPVYLQKKKKKMWRIAANAALLFDTAP